MKSAPARLGRHWAAFLFVRLALSLPQAATENQPALAQILDAIINPPAPRNEKAPPFLAGAFQFFVA